MPFWLARLLHFLCFSSFVSFASARAPLFLSKHNREGDYDLVLLFLLSKNNREGYSFVLVLSEVGEGGQHADSSLVLALLLSKDNRKERVFSAVVMVPALLSAEGVGGGGETVRLLSKDN